MNTLTTDIRLSFNKADLVNVIITRSRQLFMKVGVKSVSMDDVAAECGISKKTLYTCFNREGLVTAVTKQQVQTFEARVKSILAENRNVVAEMTGLLLFTMDAAQEVSLQFLYSVKTAHAGIYKNVEAFSGIVQQAIVNNLEKGKLQGLYRNDMEPAIVVQLYTSQLQEIMERQPIDRASDWMEELYKLFLFGILTPQGQEFL